jgi:hypothetical protein
MQALKLGIGELLCTFRDAVCAVEEQAIEDPGLPLTRVRYLLREFEVTMPAAWSLVDYITTYNLTGGQVRYDVVVEGGLFIYMYINILCVYVSMYLCIYHAISLLLDTSRHILSERDAIATI